MQLKISELLLDADGNIKGRQLIASGSPGAGKTESAPFTMVSSWLVNIITDIHEYTDSSCSVDVPNHLQNNEMYMIQPNGEIINAN